jgi:hypothetical protein
MSADEWLWFVGVPALFAIALLIADWAAVRRRRVLRRIPTTLDDEESLHRESGSSPIARPINPFAELERLTKYQPPKSV